MVASSVAGSGNAQTLFDFTRIASESALEQWTENSDTKKNFGMSKATIVLQKSKTFQRAVLFTLLNPTKNGGGYAAVQCETNFNIGEFNNIAVRCRAQGINVNYKVILRHKGLDKNCPLYGQVFTAPRDDFATIKLALENFKPYHRGLELPVDTNPLDVTAITNIGLKIDKSTFLPDNEAGVAALEIDWIKATK